MRAPLVVTMAVADPSGRWVQAAIAGSATVHGADAEFLQRVYARLKLSPGVLLTEETEWPVEGGVELLPRPIGYPQPRITKDGIVYREPWE